jgi:hypothetical protein
MAAPDTIEAGKLDRRLTILKHTVTKGAFNADVVTYADAGAVWAERIVARDGEKFRAAQVGATVTCWFRVRHSALTDGLTVLDQGECDGVRYAFSGKKEIGRRVGYELTATGQAIGT